MGWMIVLRSLSGVRMRLVNTGGKSGVFFMFLFIYSFHFSSILTYKERRTHLKRYSLNITSTRTRTSKNKVLRFCEYDEYGRQYIILFQKQISVNIIYHATTHLFFIGRGAQKVPSKGTLHLFLTVKIYEREACQKPWPVNNKRIKY